MYNWELPSLNIVCIHPFYEFMWCSHKFYLDSLGKKTPLEILLEGVKSQ